MLSLCEDDILGPVARYEGISSGYPGTMTKPGLVVIGSGPAGMSAAEEFRRHDDASPITIPTDDGDPPYARPPLSKECLRGKTNNVELHPTSWYEERSIAAVTSVEVQRLDLDARRVLTPDANYSYRALVLACGAEPTPLPVPGGTKALQLRSLADADRLRGKVSGADSAVVIGAGFIGCEVAASLALQGVSVTLVAPEPAPQTARLGLEAGERLRALVERTGVRYVGEPQVTRLEDGAVRLDDGVTIDTDLIVAATGVTPRSALADTAGLAIRDGRVAVCADLATSVPGVYAAGDVASAVNATARRPLAIEHWQDAADQGSLAGAGAAGAPGRWAGLPGFWITIGESTVKYRAWEDGCQRSRLLGRGDGFTAWYEADGAVVGVLTCDADDDYELGEALISRGKPAPVPLDKRRSRAG